jgi:hypothetical protein
MDNEGIDSMVLAHWRYVHALLEVHGVSEDQLIIIGFHYKSAMYHGYKHGIEDGKIKNRDNARNIGGIRLVQGQTPSGTGYIKGTDEVRHD